LTKEKLTPGPGNYEIDRSLKSTKVVFGKETRPKIKETLAPGPGNYHIPCTFAEVPKYSMPNQSKEVESFKFI